MNFSGNNDSIGVIKENTLAFLETYPESVWG